MDFSNGVETLNVTLRIVILSSLEEKNNIRSGLYRPFIKKWLYFSDIIVDEPGANRRLFQTATLKLKTELYV